MLDRYLGCNPETCSMLYIDYESTSCIIHLRQYKYVTESECSSENHPDPPVGLSDIVRAITAPLRRGNDQSTRQLFEVSGPHGP